MKNIKYLKSIATVLVLVIFVFLVGCEEELVNQPETSGVTPEQVTNVQVESLNGAAVITYDVVGDATDYVLVEYETSPGVKREQKASIYLDSLLIEGFPTAGSYPFKLYSVNISEKRSEPLEMTADVLETPLEIAFKTLSVRRDFGGININAVNAGKGDLVIETIVEDENLQVLKTADLHYSTLETIKYNVRGYESVPRNFWVTMRDRWGHRSDTLKIELTPFYEEDIPQNTINANIILPTDYDYDNTWATWAGGTNNLFDGNTRSLMAGFTNPEGESLHVTFEFGKEITLSRFTIWQRQGNSADYYNGPSPKIFELWGSNDPSNDGSFDSWTLIDRYEIIKPSGSPRGENTAEDLAALVGGHEFIVPIEYGKLRYMRLKTIEAWSGAAPNLMISELRFWGNRE